MYRKKEKIGIAIIILGIVIFFVWGRVAKESQVEDTVIQEKSLIQIKLEGEVIRPTEVSYLNPVPYGVLFLRVENCLNEFSDLSGFPLEAMIQSSITIYIPSLDKNNAYDSKAVVHINTATLQELKQLPQIGDKRAEKILSYVKDNGRIDSWEKFFEITSVPDAAKEKIMEQAIL